MALKATVVKAELQVSDMDRHYYASHALTLAQHPSETDERLMVRLAAFALFADERLEFGRGISSDGEPALWRKDRTGAIEQWIEVGQPDEADLRRACGRAREVVVVTYSGRSADIWWEKVAPAAGKLRNLAVIDLAPAEVKELSALLAPRLQLQCLVQDGQLQWLAGDASVAMAPRQRQAMQA